jgi:hypothetical protein
MADRYWVGGSGAWDASNTTNWAASSGGAGGESVPTAADAVFFNSSSGGGTCTLEIVAPCLTLNLSGYTGTLAFGSNKIQIAGNSTTVFTQTTSCSVSGTPVIDLTSTSSTGTRTIAATSVAAENTISFNVLGGSDVIGMSSARVRALDFTGFSGTLAAGTKFINGNLTFSTGMTLTAGNFNLTLRNVTSGSTSTLITNGKTINNPVLQDNSGTWVLGDSLTINPTYGLTIDAGVFNANGNNVSISTLSSSGSVSRTLAIGSGTWTVSGSGTAWNCATITNLTVTGNGVISMTSSSTKTFAGGGASWPILNQGGSGELIISGSNAFRDITNTYRSTGSTTITFTAGTTQAVSSFTAAGTAGKLLTLQSSVAGTQFTLSDLTGVVNVAFCSIKDSIASGGARWQSYFINGNINAGNNLGWIFTKKGASTVSRLRKWVF